ncbi:L,D-transpeptidase [Roseisalinus antarcticus]|uniref:Putative L,D-transpeptidase YbiS n=1 Tax=Roseisalinus antarcticus TaxID=254357 RepID=A0A1Y5SNM0_9RHOB|nr:L,D-transpeptidase [Roseisalinus antarcticus]SLN43160.1 putative L,D-transpeptidase YbiS precursor [Roseisalinus antarcticus]
MLNRREIALSALAAGSIGICAPAEAQTLSHSNYRVPYRHRPRWVRVDTQLTPGVIYAWNSTRQLFWVQEPGRAMRYVIAIGAEGRAFEGTARVSRKAIAPGWRPTESMIRMEPQIYGRFRNGLPGGHPMNPLGAAALYLDQGGRDTFYRIHGTPQPWTMGRSFSSGCLRLVNEHMMDLYARVPVGTPVVVI